MLIILGGLPGSGKTTIAKALAARLGAAHLRIDSIEQALVRSGEMPERPQIAGYAVAYAIAEDCLRAGATVIADSVNPIAITRRAWLEVGNRTNRPALEVGIVCSDPAEHRRRVEIRTADIEGHVQPVWQEVIEREFETWSEGTLVIDTSSTAVEAAVDAILDRMHHRN